MKPLKPVNPTKPLRPVNPKNQLKPTNHAKPVNPTKPPKLVNPTKQLKPVNPRSSFLEASGTFPGCHKWENPTGAMASRNVPTGRRRTR